MRHPSKFPVVGIGASAGGLEAFTELLRHLPPDTGMAFVLVQHLAPGHKSLLTELLARETSMPVLEATQGQAVTPDSVYVIPAGQDLTIDQGRLRLSTRDPAVHHMPVDSFLISLARDRRDQAIGVVLSGTAADGAAGVRAVKAAGGLTIAQDPSTASHQGMPDNAIATGATDLVLPVDLIARHLAQIGPGKASKREDSLPDASQDDGLIADLLSLVQDATGADFSHYKRSTLLRRIGRRMTLLRAADLQDYLRRIRDDPEEIEALYQDILIHVTSFFRQPSVFETLKQVAFPQIAEARASTQVRFWVPGCASGEEAYSLGMAWAEFAGTDDPGKLSFQVFATDLNQQVIDKARAAVYPDSIASDVSPERLRRFFTPVEGGYRVVKSLRDSCVFAKHDLIRDPPFSRLDLVSLRNVLIYLDPLLQRRVMPLLHYAIRPGAFLLLGESETIGGFTDLFGIIDKKAKLYVRRESVVAVPPPRPSPRSGAATTATDRPSREFDLSAEADRIVLDTYAPTGVIVDADLQIRQFRGKPDPYLQVAPGRASFDLIRMAREGLAGELHNAFREATKDGVPVHREDVRMIRDGRVVAVGVSVIPIVSPTGESSYLVLFRDVPRAAEERMRLEPTPVFESTEAASRKLAEVEQELGDMREYARAVLEDKEAANEELRSANEELQSANEELQSVNEELETTSEEVQSTNEELQTLNDELRALNEVLDRRDVELRNARDFSLAVVDTVREPLVVLDSELRIVSANESFYRVFRSTAAGTLSRAFFGLESGRWDVAGLPELVSRVVLGEDFQDFKVEQSFGQLGRRTMLLSGRHIHAEVSGQGGVVLLAIDDITERAQAEALSETLDEINLTMISSLDYREILNVVLLRGAAALNCDEAGLVVQQKGSPGVCYSLAAGQVEVGACTQGEVALPSSPPRAQQVMRADRRAVEVTLRSGRDVVGVLSFSRAVTDTAFSDAELDFLDKLAPALALALENAHLYSTERHIAQVLQASLLGSITAPPEFEIGVVYRPAYEAGRVGGDFYDLFELEGGSVAVLVGDVSGKGIEAASLTGTVRAVIRAFASLDQSPASVLSRANSLLPDQIPPGLFVTVLLAVIDPSAGTIRFSSAGHPPAILCGAEPRFLEVIPGTPLGLGNCNYRETDFAFPVGETLVLYTDGLIEARNGKELFGEDRVAETLSGERCDDVQGLVEGLVSRATDFAGGRLQDDLAVMAVRMSRPPRAAAQV